MDISECTIDELRDLMNRASVRIDQLIAEEQGVREDARSRLAASITTLDNLIGPENPEEPGLESLSEVLLFTQEEMGAATGLAHRLAFLALDILTRAVRDIATVQGESTP